MEKKCEIRTTLTTNYKHLHIFPIALVDGFATCNGIIYIYIYRNHASCGDLV